MPRHYHWLTFLPKRLTPKHLVIMLLPLAGCAQLPPDYSPNYSYVPVVAPDGRVRYVLAPDACLTPDPTDRQLGPRLPPGCANAANLLAMADRKRDVVQGRKLGLAPAAPAARAAQRYIYGPRDSREPLGAGVGRPGLGIAPAGTTVEPEVSTVAPNTALPVSR
jgi:hypothetical protein